MWLTKLCVLDPDFLRSTSEVAGKDLLPDGTTCNEPPFIFGMTKSTSLQHFSPTQQSFKFELLVPDQVQIDPPDDDVPLPDYKSVRTELDCWLRQCPGRAAARANDGQSLSQGLEKKTLASEL